MILLLLLLFWRRFMYGPDSDICLVYRMSCFGQLLGCIKQLTISITWTTLATTVIQWVELGGAWLNLVGMSSMLESKLLLPRFLSLELTSSLMTINDHFCCLTNWIMFRPAVLDARQSWPPCTRVWEVPAEGRVFHVFMPGEGYPQCSENSWRSNLPPKMEQYAVCDQCFIPGFSLLWLSSFCW